MKLHKIAFDKFNNHVYFAESNSQDSVFISTWITASGTQLITPSPLIYFLHLACRIPHFLSFLPNSLPSYSQAPLLIPPFLPQSPQLSSSSLPQFIYINILGDLPQSYNFKCHPQTHNTQMYIWGLDLCTVLQNHLTFKIHTTTLMSNLETTNLKLDSWDYLSKSALPTFYSPLFLFCFSLLFMSNFRKINVTASILKYTPNPTISHLGHSLLPFVSWVTIMSHQLVFLTPPLLPKNLLSRQPSEWPLKT